MADNYIFQFVFNIEFLLQKRRPLQFQQQLLRLVVIDLYMLIKLFFNIYFIVVTITYYYLLHIILQRASLTKHAKMVVPAQTGYAIAIMVTMGLNAKLVINIDINTQNNIQLYMFISVNKDCQFHCQTILDIFSYLALDCSLYWWRDIDSKMSAQHRDFEVVYFDGSHSSRCHCKDAYPDHPVNKRRCYANSAYCMNNGENKGWVECNTVVSGNLN